MKPILWVIAGLVLNSLFILGVGILTIQIIALKGGGVLGLDNQLIAVTKPSPALLQLLGIASLSTLVLLALTFGVAGREPVSRTQFRSGFVVTSIVLITAATIMVSVDYVPNTLQLGFSVGPRGWLEEGGISPAVHIVFLVALAVLWLDPGVRTRGKAQDSSSIPEAMAK